MMKPQRRSKKKEKKPKSARAKLKYPALSKMNLLSRMEQIDYDYVKKLEAMTKYVDEDKVKQEQVRNEGRIALRFLNDFTEGYINADFRSDTVKDLFKDHDHIRKEAYRRNNYRNKDGYTKAKAKGFRVPLNDWMLENEREKRGEYVDHHDKMINDIELKNSENELEYGGDDAAGSNDESDKG